MRSVTAALETWVRWDCRLCGETVRTPHTPDTDGDPYADLCSDCTDATTTRLGRRRILLDAGCPRLYTDTAFDNPTQGWPKDPVKGVELSTWSGSPPLILLHGTTGTGKTMIGTELFWRLCNRKPNARWVWVSATEAVGLVLSTFPSERQQALSRYSTAAVLLLDDVGTWQENDGRAWDVTFQIVSSRLNRLLPTIVTTNRKPEEIAAVHDPLYDRLQAGLFVPMYGPSRR